MTNHHKALLNTKATIDHKNEKHLQYKKGPQTKKGY